MKDRFLRFIAHNTLVEKTSRVLLAVSGGLDSMVMLHLFHQVGFEVGVAHCNFALRDEESDEDERFVKSICEGLSVPFFSKRFSTKNYARDNGLSTQMAAHDLRYDWFSQLVDQENYSRVATAHHLNDSIETVVLNLARGTGWQGLTGIAVKTDKIIRPMLCFTREEIEAYARENTIMWREDGSNASDDYQRNLIRHHIVPRLKELNPSLEKTFEQTQERLYGASEMITRHLTLLEKQFIQHEGGKIIISNKLFDSMDHKIAIFSEFIKGFGFNYSQTTDIINSLNGQSGKRFFSSTHLLVIDRTSVIITLHQSDWSETKIDTQQLEALLGPWRLGIESISAPNLRKGSNEATIDSELIKFPLTWRKWRQGDSFIPLGMETRKKVSDFLIDKKVSMTDKEVVTVLESEGQIVWLVGHRIDNRFKVTEKTRSVINFSIQPHFN